MAKREKMYHANAGLFRRLAAFVLDLLILNMLVLEPFRNIFQNNIQVSSLTELYSFLMENDTAYNTLYVSSVFISIIALLYFAILEWKLGQTLGKMLFGIYVVDENGESIALSDGSHGISFWKALVRSLYFIPAFPFVLLVLADPIFMVFNKNSQRLSEIISKTRVVQKFAYAG